MIKTLLNKPLTVLTIFTLAVIIGAFMIGGLPVDLMPDMDPPYMYVSTVYPAAGPEEVEEDITDPLEEQFYTLEGLKTLTSTSSEGKSGILMEFSWGDNPDEVKQNIRDELDIAAAQLPDDAEDPLLLEFDPNSAPIVTLSIQGNRDSEELYALADEEVRPRLEQVPDVSKVEIKGGRDRIVRVAVSGQRLEAYGLSTGQIAQALAGQNLALGAGTVDQAENEFLVRTSGKYHSLEEIRGTVVTSLAAEGEIHKVYIRDVARVDYAYEEAESEVLIDGSPSVQLEVYKKSGANTVETAAGVQQAAEEAALLLPPGTDLKILSDSSEVIEQSLASVLSAAVTGILCSILVLLLFLRQARSTLIVAVSIPVSLMITITFMSLAGKTLNVVALTGLTLGVGMIVDSSIVILENIFSHRERGERLQAASLFGTREMVSPIIASTLTTVSVFLPILLFGGRIGAIGAVMNDLAFTVIIALLSSLAVAVFLVPVLASHFLKIHTRKERPLTQPVLKALDRLLERALERLGRLYRRLLAAALARPWAAAAFAAVLLTVSIVQIPKLGLSFTPPQPAESVTLEAEQPLGRSLEATKDLMEEIEVLARQNLEEGAYEALIRTSGSSGSHTGQLKVVLPDLGKRPMDEDEVKAALRRIFPLYPEVIFTLGQGGMSGPVGGGGFSMTVRGDSLEGLMAYGQDLLELVKGEIPEIQDPVLDVRTGRPQWDIVLDRSRLSDLGLNVQAAAAEIRNQMAGTTATSITDEDGETLDVVVELQDTDKGDIPDLQKLFVRNPQGRQIPVASFASIEQNEGPEAVAHTDQQRSVTLSGQLAPGVGANFAVAAVEKAVAEELPAGPGMSLEFGGEMEDIRESGSGLLLVLVFAVLLVLAVMISQFESLRAPFIVLFSMPLLSVGVIGLYLLMGVEFSMISLIGVVMLVGIVVNNGIVLVDYIALLRARGYGLAQACLEGGASRFRPILMTTLTTIFSMVPLAFFAGEGGDMMQPLAVTGVGGLTVNTAITLVLVPVLYSLFYQKEA